MRLALLCKLISHSESREQTCKNSIDLVECQNLNVISICVAKMYIERAVEDTARHEI